MRLLKIHFHAKFHKNLRERPFSDLLPNILQLVKQNVKFLYFKQIYGRKTKENNVSMRKC